MAATSSQWEPRLYRNTVPVEPPAGFQDGYHLTTDLVNDALHWVREHDAVAPDKPFFLYFATGATHAPHQVPKPWIDKYKGQFDQGWDKLREETFARQKAARRHSGQRRTDPAAGRIAGLGQPDADQKRLLCAPDGSLCRLPVANR